MANILKNKRIGAFYKNIVKIKIFWNKQPLGESCILTKQDILKKVNNKFCTSEFAILKSALCR